MCTEPEQVVQDAGDLVEQDTDVLCPDRRRDAEQLFDHQNVAVLVAYHRDIVQPVHVADALVVRFGLCQFFGGTVQQADVRIGAMDDFAVHLENQPQDSMCRRVLRPEIHRKSLDLRHRLPHPPVLRNSGRRRG